MNQLTEIHDRTVEVLLVEDDPADARLLDAWLSEADQVRYCVHRAANLAAALTILDARRVDAVLLDLDLPDSQGLETVRRILDVAGGLPVVVLMQCDDEDLGLQVMRLGTQDVLVKGRDRSAVVRRSLRYAMHRQKTLNRLSRRSAAAPADGAGACASVLGTLSPRLRELLPMLVGGLSNKQIARHMAVTEATVKLHVRRLCKILGVTNRTRAALLAAVMMEEEKTRACPCKGTCRVLRNLRRVGVTQVV